MANKNFNKPMKAKSNIIQYIIMALICLPLLVWFGYMSNYKWHLSSALTIFIMCLIILTAWIVWVSIRMLFHKRATKIYKEKLAKRNEKTRG